MCCKGNYVCVLTVKSDEDIVTKFFEHFCAIANAAYKRGETSLWNEGAHIRITAWRTSLISLAEDGFFYDVIAPADVTVNKIPLRIRSFVGLIPVFAVAVVRLSATCSAALLTRCVASAGT